MAPPISDLFVERRREFQQRLAAGRRAGCCILGESQEGNAAASNPNPRLVDQGTLRVGDASRRSGCARSLAGALQSLTEPWSHKGQAEQGSKDAPVQ